MYLFPPGTAIPRIAAFGDDLLEHPELRSWKTADRSPISRPHRRSGLSEPYAAIASAYSMAKRASRLTAAHLEDALNERLDQAEDQVRRRERHFDVDLGELGLTIGAQVLVAETTGDLIVAIGAGDHQDLLENLRRLRQRENSPG